MFHLPLLFRLLYSTVITCPFAAKNARSCETLDNEQLDIPQCDPFQRTQQLSISSPSTTISWMPFIKVPSFHGCIAQSLSIETSDLETNPLRVIKLKAIMKEVTCVLKDNRISMNIEFWGGRENK